MKNLGLKNLENVKGGNCFIAGFIIIPSMLLLTFGARSEILAGFAYCMVT